VILDSFGLTGKVAVVTGGNQGLGRAFARGLGEAGAKVAVLGRNQQRNEDAVAELVLDGIQARAFAADVVDKASLESAADAIEAQLGPVDILVNNAGTCIHRPAFEVTDDEFAEVMNVNVTGVWNGCQVFGKRMPAAVAAGLQRLEGSRAPAHQVAGGGVGAAGHPGQRHRTRVRPDRDGSGGPAGVPPVLDRGRAAAAGGATRGDRPERRLPGVGGVGVHDGLGTGHRWRLHALLT
jgi:NAD(P)-dependent dehydrogenase (short-subunit alcohol dehydrogenase family)